MTGPWRLVVVLPVAAVVLSACGRAAGSPVEIDGDPVEALEAAAQQDLGTVAYAMEVRIVSATLSLHVVSDGLVEPDGDSRQRMTVTYELPEDERRELEEAGVLDELTADGKIEWISTGGAVYMRSTSDADPLRAGRRPMPPGVDWVVSGGGPHGFSSLDTSELLEPLGILDELGEVTTVEDRGPSEIDGQRVRWLRGSVGRSAEASDDAWLRPGSVLDVYLDAQGRVRRLVHLRENSDGRTDARIDYLDFDSDETVTAPPEGTTIRMEELYQRDSP